MPDTGAFPIRTTAAVLAVSLLAAVVIAYAESAAGHTPQRHEIRIEGFAFKPQSLRVAVGDTVVWVNNDIVPHTATDKAGKWDSGALQKNARWTMVASTPGEQKYDCTLHPTMTGSIVVR